MNIQGFFYSSFLTFIFFFIIALLMFSEESITTLIILFGLTICFNIISLFVLWVFTNIVGK